MNSFIMSITHLVVMTASDGLYLAIDVLWGLVSWFEKTWDPESQKSAVADLLGSGDPSQLYSLHVTHKLVKPLIFLDI